MHVPTSSAYEPVAHYVASACGDRLRANMGRGFHWSVGSRRRGMWWRAMDVPRVSVAGVIMRRKVMMRLAYRVSEGVLSLTAFIDEQGQIRSGKLTTAGKHSFKHGYIEARIRLPHGRGLWPAFWMMPEGQHDGWPLEGEIDILEWTGHEPSPDYRCNSLWRSYRRTTCITARRCELLPNGAVISISMASSGLLSE